MAYIDLTADVRSFVKKPIAEKSEFRYTAKLVDETGSAVPASLLTTLKLTLYVLNSTLAIINSVTQTNILNTDRGSVDSGGNLVILLQPADNVIADDNLPEERHVMLVEFTYAGGAKAGRHEVEFGVANMAKVS